MTALLRLGALSIMLLVVACGGGQSPGGGAPAAPAAAPASPRVAELCATYERIYCAYEDDGQKSFADLDAAAQAELRAECGTALGVLAAAGLDVVERCLGCLGECSSADSCLDGIDDGCEGGED